MPTCVTIYAILFLQYKHTPTVWAFYCGIVNTNRYILNNVYLTHITKSIHFEWSMCGYVVKVELLLNSADIYFFSKIE
jgi:hypothetical protein